MTTTAPESALSNGASYRDIELGKIRISPDNRKRFNEAALQELAASIKSMGVAQPILIRPVTPTVEQPEEYEIVAGERRYRASTIAGMGTIPAIIRQLSDLDAAKIRILENLQRENPHEMEEAEGYQLLMLQHGYNADQLADEVKKSRAYIYGRLKLCALTTEVREQFLDNKIPASTALLIARIPVPALQVKALQEILFPYGPQSEALSYRKAVEHVQRRYMLDLAGAVFKLTDSNLLASAGPCTKCPKRTGNQPELFPGLSADVCTDPDCFAEKRAAHHVATLATANKKGIPVYEGEEAEKRMRDRWRADGEVVFGDTALRLFARNAPETKNAGTAGSYLQDAMPTVIGYVKERDGAMLALYERTAMQAALEAAGACETVEAHAARMTELANNPSPKPKKSAAELQREAEQAEHQRLVKLAEKEKAFRLEVIKRLRVRGAGGFSLQTLREFTKHAITRLALPVRSLAGIYDFDTSSNEAIFQHIDEAGLPEVQLLLVDVLLANTLDVSCWQIKNKEAAGQFAHVLAMCRSEGIDPDAVREELYPTPIDVTDMGGSDLVEFITKNPHRLHELTKTIVTHPRGELTGMLETACNILGYTWSGLEWVKQDAPAVAAQMDEPTTAAAIEGAGEVTLEETPIANADELTTTPAAAPAAADVTQETAPIDAAPAVKPTPAKIPKTAKSKTASASQQKENTPKAKTTGKGAAPADAFANEPWPFPKSSDMQAKPPKAASKKIPAEVAA